MFESSSHGGYLSADLYTGANFPSSYLDPTTIAGHQFYGGSVNGTSSAAGSTGNSQSAASLGPIGSSNVATSNVNGTAQQQDKTALVDGLNNFGLGSVASYPASQYQHLLVAN